MEPQVKTSQHQLPSTTVNTGKIEQKVDSPNKAELTQKPTKEEDISEIEKKFNDRLNEVWDEHYLSEFQRAAANHFVKSLMSNRNNEKVTRARQWLLNQINKKKNISKHEWQRGCAEVIPGLRGIPWWDTVEFPWVKAFEDNYEVIRDQLISLRNEKGFQPYRGPSWATNHKAKDGVGSESHDSGNWNVFYLMLHDMKFDVNCQKVPKTMELIQKHLPRNYHHCFFSAVTEKTHIIKHHGPSNKKLRFHMPLLGVKGSRLRVADITREQTLGKCYVFDDSFEHEAWHDGDETRVILICDFWHPDFSDEEVRFFNFLQTAKMRFQKKIAEKDPERDNFYSIIETAKTLILNNDWWVVSEQTLGNQTANKDENNKTEEKGPESSIEACEKTNCEPESHANVSVESNGSQPTTDIHGQPHTLQQN